MRLIVDTASRSLKVTDGDKDSSLDLYGKEAFELISDLWMKLSWQQKYSYTFTWFGRPIIQHPEDMVRMQEVIHQLKPDVIVETGVAHGGSLIFNASLLQNIGKGRVVGVDIEIRPHNRAAIEAHPLAPMITLIEGDSVAPDIVGRVRALIKPGDTVLVILDSDHSRRHVRAELEAYHPLVSVGSYIVATDGIMREVYDTPRGKPDWLTDNPATAAREFLAEHPDFELSVPKWMFNESDLDKVITGHPDAWLKRVR
ncbi:cephalosporin hydroxylase family protein [Limobrevibacterium gyesilva]|uniref:Cephalosporin hydroxylase family protein n=1 Tax=Limobrevibacterium gyesilva TaxID=2991712 RepID=A0AA41YI53_9PROT|nr:cephalosporin hydroxylase family protein [Limobrevibacterium gyesilva]MCW3473931.1 cephalosporin hydroxylase family protein [Limobrevibacterium gyesilva]